ncbi:bifunctional 5,10-methylenetetrahydrofolate dehydrogenase/5,10-methenyltetrahydrofolate cyclohydrolase [Ferroacidibacillus organovorans]|uniref:Bifunctional protein FolD n=1 Tax=Ferroacidibacillus organovorans TaxID=1765683 RepID=A0A853KG02_9BACL|nr:tetrahydrofolate dehydrogenase/cyclohydrolase catalytic domain-containing protein [Ferroacidibacillus organovorans]KYP81005.1 bifunctional 5,10-methylene-tetrahydrofolate dehydrogenase/5,10-methylene-tetrahydrofolate cyclohydrolase [Ferroacidibacillus organovorans]OAG94290.1 bifunctional 5,10-methylene-tetrahydrofolate dehydrogenase/5,10-methylene-tetrahydrofolate cyclohydrolase [Ferroacidibacillus organovorans]
MGTIIDGAHWADISRQETAQKVHALKKEGVTPHLVVLLIGDHPASASYVRGKEKAAQSVGIASDIMRFPAETEEQVILDTLDRLNQDPLVHGILVQLPLPAHMNEQRVVARVAFEKDVDGFHERNVGALSIGTNRMVPCTPLGVMELLRYEQIDLAGMHAVVIGRSNIVGKPMANLLLQANATVTICHSRTKNMRDWTRQADLLVAAVGIPRFVTADDVKKGAVVIDVGINRVDGKICGDVDFSSVESVASKITPVPKGVGPMTIAMLLSNTVRAAQMQQQG